MFYGFLRNFGLNLMPFCIYTCVNGWDDLVIGCIFVML